MPAPPVPDPISVESSSGRVQLSWAAVAGAERYDVQRRIRYSGAAWDHIGVSISSTTYVDNTVVNNTVYEYQVRSIDLSDDTTSDWSASVFGWPRAPSPFVVVGETVQSFIERLQAIRSRWRFILAYSHDMNERIGELSQARGRKCDVLLNRPGSAECQYPMDADYANSIAPYKTCIITERFNWRATLARREAGLYGQVWDPIWSGYILNSRQNWDEGKIDIAAVGWLARLGKIHSRAKIVLNNTDDGATIMALVRAVNGHVSEHAAGINNFVATDGTTIRWPLGATPNTPTFLLPIGELPDEGVGGSTPYVSQLRSNTYEVYSPILPQIEALNNLENGCDVHVDPVTRELSVHRRYRRDRNNVVIAFNWGPSNVAQFGRDIDGDRKTNHVLARGDIGTTPQYAEDIDDMLECGPIEEVHNLSGVKSNSTLLAFAGAEVLVRNQGVITYGITPFTYIPEGSVPEPFVEYREGDYVSVEAYRSNMDRITGGGVRVFGLSVTLDDNNNERLGQLQLSP